MRGFVNVLGIGIVWFIATLGWLALAGVTGERRSTQETNLREKVNDLWGQEQHQRAPSLSFRPELPTAEPGPAAPVDYASEAVPATLTSSKIKAKLHSDPRRKGLVWYALYDVAFAATYTYLHDEDRPGLLRIELALPTQSAGYDNLVFSVDGRDQSAKLDSKSGLLSYELRVLPKQLVTFAAGYESRGMDAWRYLPAEGVGRLNSFSLDLVTDFASIDFPAQSLSPSSKIPNERGWTLRWDFRQIVTGQSIGMVMPARIQPGELAAALAFSAPLSLLFFFVVVFVLATLRNIDVHPINYLMIAAAFFAFHLLFAYSVDHLSVQTAFALCSVVSMVLVVSYLRLVVSNTFAFREAALAQLIYLIGFSLAHFWEGFTGLTVTVLAILTLFVIMQLTGRVRWHDALRRGSGRPHPPMESGVAGAS